MGVGVALLGGLWAWTPPAGRSNYPPVFIQQVSRCPGGRDCGTGEVDGEGAGRKMSDIGSFLLAYVDRHQSKVPAD